MWVSFPYVCSVLIGRKGRKGLLIIFSSLIKQSNPGLFTCFMDWARVYLKIEDIQHLC